MSKVTKMTVVLEHDNGSQSVFIIPPEYRPGVAGVIEEVFDTVDEDDSDDE